MLTAYEVSYELLEAHEYVEGQTVREFTTCRQDISCQFIKKGAKVNIDIKPERRPRESGIYQPDYIRLDGQTQSVGDHPFTLTLDMNQPHELIYGWRRLTADLVIEEIVTDPPTPSLQQGQEFELFVKVRNNGAISALASDRTPPLSGETEVVVEIKGIGRGIGFIRGGLLCQDPPQCTRLKDTSIQPGESRLISILRENWTPWAAPFAPSVIIEATVDLDDVIDEGITGGEKNNTRSLIVTLATATLPDQAFKDPKADVGFTQVGPTVLGLQATVTNLSPVAASNVVVRFITDAPKPVGGRVIGEGVIRLLQGNSTQRVEVDWEICKVPGASYTIGVGIDPDNQIHELNERNNNTGLSVDVPASANKAKLTTDKSVYQTGEIVTISFFNGCSQMISLRNSAPWVIKDSRGRVIFAPTALPVITEARPGETKTWQWDQKDNNRQQVPAGSYTVELETMDAGTYTASFEIKAIDKAKLDVKAVGQIRQGPIAITFEINIPVLINGVPMTTPASLQLDKNKPVWLTAQQLVTVYIPVFGQRPLVFKQWECQAQGEPKQVFSSPTTIFTLSKDTTCTVVYVEEE